jgi:hypothetical protein
LLSDYGVSQARGNDHLHLIAAEAIVLVIAFAFWARFARRGAPLAAVPATPEGPAAPVDI